MTTLGMVASFQGTVRLCQAGYYAEDDICLESLLGFPLQSPIKCIILGCGILVRAVSNR